MNEYMQIERNGADVIEVEKAIGTDSRIGPTILTASIQFRDSCFQKDIPHWQQVFDMNEYMKIVSLRERAGADVTEVDKAIGIESRIGSKILIVSAELGRSCFQNVIF